MKLRYRPLILWSLLFFYLPLSLLLGFSNINWGARIFKEHLVLNSLFSFIFLLGFIHLFIVFPSYYLFIDNNQKELPLYVRRLGLTLLLSIPLLGLLYYLGRVESLVDYREIAITLISSVLVSVLWGESFQSRFPVSLFLTVALFVPVYLANDILAPFSVVIAFYAKSNNFYWLRNITPLLAVVVAFYWASYSTKRA